MLGIYITMAIFILIAAFFAFIGFCEVYKIHKRKKMYSGSGKE